MVAVKDTEMPKSCALCERFLGACRYTDFGDYQTEKNPSCPLVEIITCKDCKHCYPDEDGRGYHCERDSNVRFSVHGDFYCAGAVRKDVANEYETQ